MNQENEMLLAVMRAISLLADTFRHDKAQPHPNLYKLT